ncbi:MAG: hypothetical protein GX060_06070 [Firmicutes bacterium]|nr:hypothetical protein [Bacillota bacterium]
MPIGNKVLLAIVFTAVLLCSIGLSWHADLFLLLLMLDRQAIRAVPTTALAEPTVARHPYARPVIEALPWEKEAAVQRLLAEHGATIRMGAFATTLPDPLPGEEHNVAHVADLLAGTVVQPGQVFSMNETLGPYTSERGFREGIVYIGGQVGRGVGGGVCKMATTLYNVAILADLPVIARRNHSMLVPYANPGQDATVSSSGVDLKFKNDTDHPIVIWAAKEDATLYVAFYGQRKPPVVTWHHEVLQVQERPLVRRMNTELAPGEERVLIPGAEGIAVKSWVVVRYADGKSITRNLGVDWYRPMPRVVEYGPPH